MLRFIIPIILLGVSVAMFFVFIQPMYAEIAELRTSSASYNEALTNSKELEQERDKLTQKFNTINNENLDKLRKMLPENVDNIRLILEIEKVAQPYGMVLKDVRYDTERQATNNEFATGSETPGYASSLSNVYGTWELEFSTTGTYSNFTSFIKDLERNLRIVDISTIEFSSNVTTPAGVVVTNASQSYDYRFTIKTYWLRD